MTRYLVLIIAAIVATGSLASVVALPAEAQQPHIVSRTTDGQPIILGTMVVTATPLSDTH